MLIVQNFALISIRQSKSVDRLTRITLLLTKATILFLPVSFMYALDPLILNKALLTVHFNNQDWVLQRATCSQLFL